MKTNHTNFVRLLTPLLLFIVAASLSHVACGQTVSGSLTTIYTFSEPDFIAGGHLSNADGCSPGTLMTGSDGNLYGTTTAGSPSEFGTLFQITTSGTLTTLHQFDPYNDGYSPNGPLIQDGHGNFYGTDAIGGDHGGSDPANYDASLQGGTVFVLSGTSYAKLYTFHDAAFTSGTNADGTQPSPGALLRGLDTVVNGVTYQNFYGATQHGGSRGGGTIYKITTDGVDSTPAHTTFTVLDPNFKPLNYFTVDKDMGGLPNAGMIQDGDGNIYGTTFFGGGVGDDCGTVFILSGTSLTTLWRFSDKIQGPSEPNGGLVRGADTLDGKKTFYGTSMSGGGKYAGTIFKITTDGTPQHTTMDVLYKFGTDDNGASPEAGLIKGKDGNFYGTTRYTRAANNTYAPSGYGTIFRITPGGTFTSLYKFSDSTGTNSQGLSTNSDGFYPPGLLQADDGTFYGATRNGGANGTGTIFKLVLSDGGGGGNPLPPITSFSVTEPASPGGEILFNATTGTGLIVRVQATSTADDDKSWVTLSDAGAMAEDQPANPGAGNYSLRTMIYPAGEAIYFRAIASRLNSTDSVTSSAPYPGPYALQPATFSIGLALSTQDPQTHAVLDPAGTTTHTGEDLVFTFAWTNLASSGTATNLHVSTLVPSYHGTDGKNHQFTQNDLAFNQFGHYVPPTTSTSNDAKIVWDVADLPAGYQQTVSLTVHVGTAVAPDYAIHVFRSDYEVYNAASSATGLTSDAPDVLSFVEGPVSLKLTVPSTSTTVRPGGYFAYTFTLSNLSKLPVAHAVAVVDVPAFARFDTSYPTQPRPVSGVAYVGRAGRPQFKQVFIANNNLYQSQVVIDLGTLQAHGNKHGLDKVVFNVTFQALWDLPDSVKQIASIDYLAAFLNPDKSTGANPYTVFWNAYRSDNTTSISAGTTDFIALLTDPNLKSIHSTRHDSGTVNVAVSGPSLGAPNLSLAKYVSPQTVGWLTDDGGNTFATVFTGGVLTFNLAYDNMGGATASDVFIQDTIPEGTQIIPTSVRFNGRSAKGRFHINTDSVGQTTIQFYPGDLAALQRGVFSYSVQLLNTNQPGAKLPGQFIQARGSYIGSSSLIHAPNGYPEEIDIQVNEPVTFDLTMVKTRSVVKVGDAITYTVFYRNNGSISATGVEVVDTLPTGAVFQSASIAPMNASSNPLVFSLGTLKAKQEGSFTITVKATSDVLTTDQLFVQNQVEIHDSSIKTARAVRTFADVSAPPPPVARIATASRIDDPSAPRYAAGIQMPLAVHPGDTFNAVLFAANLSGFARRTSGGLILGFQVPAGLKVISATDANSAMNPNGTANLQYAALHYFDPNTNQAGTGKAGDIVWWQLQTKLDNGAVLEGLQAHMAKTVLVTFQVLSDTQPGTSIIIPDAGLFQFNGTALITGVLAGTVTTKVIASDVDLNTVGPQAVGAYLEFLGGDLSNVVANKQGVNKLQQFTSFSTATSVGGADTVTFSVNAVIIPLGDYNVLTFGDANTVVADAADADNFILAKANGSVFMSSKTGALGVTANPANLIKIATNSSLGFLSCADALTKLPQLQTMKLATIVQAGGGNLFSRDNKSLISNTDGSVIAPAAATLTHDVTPVLGGYVVSNDGGSVVSNDGGSVVSNDGGSVIGEHSSGVVSNDGGSMLPTGGAALPALRGSSLVQTTDEATALISQRGANLISEKGNGLISPDRAGIIGENGSGLIGQDPGQ